jgi:hypothetical protein
VRVVVPKDTSPPVISLYGKAQTTLFQGQTFVDAGAFAVDETDGVVEVTTSGTVNSDHVGVHILTYSAFDLSGNAAEPKTRIVKVMPNHDTNPPTISLAGDDYLTVLVDNYFDDPGAIATDAEDGEVSIVTKGIVDTANTGVYTLTYEASDQYGNKAIPVTRIVEVILPKDIEPPNLELNGDSYVEILVGDNYVDPGSTAFDTIDGPIEASSSGNLDVTTPGYYSITYIATDLAGNKATPVVRIIRVKEVDQPRSSQSIRSTRSMKFRAKHKLHIIRGERLSLHWDGNARLMYSESPSKKFVEVEGAQSPFYLNHSMRGFYKLSD